MVRERVLPGEVNSDTTDSVQSFVTAALTNCVERGSKEYFVAFSSHGGGFDGFGGDDNKGRYLSQSNSNIATALANSLSSVTGSPAQFDVLGFDACLMQSFEAIDDFEFTAKYLLASEATEPGHGKFTMLLAANTSISRGSLTSSIPTATTNTSLL
jgi:hypothetical protein